MPSKKSILLKSQGFTLVELLIVVAIIGVLASQGVPAYRRMIMKSRKGEAQIMLGNIATAESAFFSEYGSYGEHLARMGATMEGIQFVYAGGVGVNANCGRKGAGWFPTALIVPALNANPSYNAALPGIIMGPAGVGVPIVNLSNMVGRGTQGTCRPAPTTTNILAGVPPVLPAYTATATGFIRGGTFAAQNNCGGALLNCDQWTINEQRILQNAVDGIN